MNELKRYSEILEIVISENKDTSINTKKAIVKTWFLCLPISIRKDDYCQIIKQNKGIDSTFDYILKNFTPLS